MHTVSNETRRPFQVLWDTSMQTIHRLHVDRVFSRLAICAIALDLFLLFSSTILVRCTDSVAP